MDVMNLLKAVPAVIGIAGLLTYLMRARPPVSDLELVNAVQRARNTFLLLACAALIMLSMWLILRPAPPDHDAALSGEAFPSRLAAFVWWSHARLSLQNLGRGKADGPVSAISGRREARLQDTPVSAWAPEFP